MLSAPCLSIRDGVRLYAPMLTTLRLSHFRCYGSLKWEIPAEGAVLLGANAQGKTSLMEAICFALTLHSPRAAKPERMVQEGYTNFGIALESEWGSRRLLWENRRLSLKTDGIVCRDFADYLTDSQPLIWLGNGDMALVQGAAEDRRRFLDFLGTQWHPEYRDALLAYRKALKSRNVLLRHPRRSHAALNSYAELLARYGECLIRLRAMLIQRLIPHVVHHHRRISGGEELVHLEYRPCAEPPLAESIRAALSTDERCGYTTIGPHRDDFSLLISGRRAADYASEGQQRTLATALLLAQSSLLHEETGQPPILLIDDIFGELDPTRRKALLGMLPAESQIFITTTHLDWLRDSPCPLPIYHIEAGGIMPQ